MYLHVPTQTKKPKLHLSILTWGRGGRLPSLVTVLRCRRRLGALGLGLDLGPLLRLQLVEELLLGIYKFGPLVVLVIGA